MVKTLENGLSAAPFLLKCYEMVNDESTDELISWNESYNNSFIIWDELRFTSELLPKFFKHSNFASFVRQLNIYGFHKTDTDRWEFSNEAFVKGQKNLLKNIVRKKHPHGQVQRKSSEEMDSYPNVNKEDARVDLIKEVESLKKHKNIMMQDLIKLRQHQQSSQSKLILLREQLKDMEKDQQQVLSFIVMALQNPGIFVQMLHPQESSWLASETGTKIVTEDGDDDDDDCEPLCTDDCEPSCTDGAIVPYQHPMAEPMELEPTRVCEPDHIPENSNAEIPLEFYFSDEIRDLLASIDFNVGPMDDKLLPLEDHGPLVLPDIPDGDDLLEQFLLFSPRPDNMESEDLDDEVSDNSGTDAVRFQ